MPLSVRVPNTPANESVIRYESIISIILSHKSLDIIIGTDQNFDYLKINEHQHTSNLFDTYISNGLIPVITRPTRITHQTASLIDNIYIKLPNETKLKSGILTSKLSDHLPIFAFYGASNKQKATSTKLQYRDLNNDKMEEIKLRLINYDWNYLHNMNSNDSFLEQVNKIIDEISPTKTRIISAKRIIREPWVTTEILKSSNKLDKLYKKSLHKSREHSDYLEYISHRNQFNKLKKKMKRDYYHEQFQQNSKNIRKTWQIMHNVIKKVSDKSNISETFKIENIETTNPKKISEGFCNYFTNVGPDLSKQIPPPIRTYKQYISIKTPTNSLFLYPTDPNEINSIVKRMKPKKSTGQDNISYWLLKQINETICQPVAILINKSMEEGTFPNKLKISKNNTYI